MTDPILCQPIDLGTISRMTRGVIGIDEFDSGFMLTFGLWDD